MINIISKPSEKDLYTNETIQGAAVFFSASVKNIMRAGAEDDIMLRNRAVCTTGGALA